MLRRSTSTAEPLVWDTRSPPEHGGADLGDERFKAVDAGVASLSVRQGIAMVIESDQPEQSTSSMRTSTTAITP